VIAGSLRAAALVMVVALHSASQVDTSTAAKNDGSAITPAEQSEALKELEAAAKPPMHTAMTPAPLVLPPPQPIAQAPTAPPIPQPPSRYAQWSKDEYMKALSAPPMIESFHKGQAQDIPSVANVQNGTSLSSTSTGSFQSSTNPIGQVHRPESPYLISAGSVIPAVLISGVNSDLPGPILAQVRENVFDTATGRWVLLPQGTKLIGSYKNDAGYGQQ
jgi:type IV secretion system protein VirB10